MFDVSWTWVLDLGDICQHLVTLEFQDRYVYVIPVGTRFIRGFGCGSPRKFYFSDSGTID